MFKIAKKGVAVMLLIIVPLIASGVSSTTYAVTVPQYLGYEGYLTDANSDAALTGYYDMVFRIYDAETAGTLLWTETYSNVRAYTGYFSVQLGSSTALNLAFDDPYWISVQVGTDAEMTPRQPINSVGYSYRSDRTYGAYSVGSAPASPTGGQIYYNSTSGKFYVYDAVGAVDWVDITTVGGLWFSGAHSTYTSGDDVVVGTSGDETITNSGFSLGGDDLFVAGDIGVEGTLYTDTGINTDTVSEATAGSGVTIDSITLKDGGSTVITGGTDTFNITNGTSSLDVAAGSALAVNANLTVESASIVNQDLTTDASVTFAGLSNADANITAVGDIALDSISSAGTYISMAPAANYGIDFNTTGTKVTCDSSTRGQIFIEEGAGGVADVTYVCKKDDADVYAWGSLGGVDGDLDMAGNDILNVDQIVGNSTYITIGDASSQNKMGTPTNDDLYVSGRLEVDGVVYLDGSVYSALNIYKTGGMLRMYDGIQLAIGTGDDVSLVWDLNGTGDDIFSLNNKKLSADDTAAMFISRDLDPNAMADHDDYTSPTWVMVNDEGADANDYAGVVIGERAQADVTATHYFDFYAMTGAADGSVDATATELAATFRFGDSGATATTHSLGAGDVLINDKLEVDGTAYFDGGLNSFSTSSFASALQFGSGVNVSTIFQSASAGWKFAVDDGHDRSFIITDSTYALSNHDHALQANPTMFIHSVLDPDTDNAEFLGLDYLGLSGGTMETDRAVFDMTLATVAPFATATGVNRDGADIIFQTSAPTNSGTVYGVTSVGANTNSNSISDTADSLFVDGKLEVDGTVYFDGALSVSSISKSASIGTIQLNNTDQTPDAPMLLTGSIANNWIIAEYLDYAFDFAHAQQTNPTVFVHSANQSTTEWLSFTHDQTDGVIDVGTGAVNFLDNVQVGDGTFAWGHSPMVGIEGILEVDGMIYADSDIRVLTNKEIQFGAYASMGWESGSNPDTLVLGLGSLSNGFVIAEKSDINVAWNHALQTNPTVYIHSADGTDVTDWLSLAHDQTDAVIAAGTGDIRFDTSIAVGRMELADDAGAVPLVDFEVSATPLQGEEESIGFAVDHETILKVYAEADTAGGIQNEAVKVKGTISTLTSGSSLTLDPLGASVVVATGTAFTPSGDQTMVDDAAVNCNDNTIARVTGNGADVVLDAAPAITDGTNDGQMCIIQGTSDSLGTVQIVDNVNTQLSAGGAFTLGKGDTLMLIWDAGDSDWYEVSRTDN